MIILGWIGVLLLFISFVALVSKSGNETFKQSFMLLVRVILTFIAFIGVIGLIAFFVVGLLIATFGEPDRTLKPTILSCNGTVVAESTNGFAYNSKGGAYEDYRNNLTYTPRQGEVCKEYLKGSE